MYLATKVEEVLIPRTSDFALSTDGGYSKEQILDMEMKIMKTLTWKLHPITIVHWANWYIQMWELYSERYFG